MDGKRISGGKDRRHSKKQRQGEKKCRHRDGTPELEATQYPDCAAAKEGPVGPSWVPSREKVDLESWPSKQDGGDTTSTQSRGHAGSAEPEQAFVRPEYEDDWEFKLRGDELDEDWCPPHRQYEEYCAMADADPSFHGYKLEYAEFRCQRSIREDEFGPNDSLDSIWGDAMDSPWPKNIQMREWRLRANRFLEVNRLKRNRLKEHPESPDEGENFVVSLADETIHHVWDHPPRHA